ncbi:uncharacterized protein LOC122501496 [Leptopilina heterotoma]|uniref:uncharacterized protein LOC122501496 n=1 Tax=Leptopilina heterotoma TaxID=63436 RepID=UPI001CA94396|nr:uncharacterized protein LOC122501496 [Leptopilina heterotoma]
MHKADPGDIPVSSSSASSLDPSIGNLTSIHNLGISTPEDQLLQSQPQTNKRSVQHASWSDKSMNDSFSISRKRVRESRSQPSPRGESTSKVPYSKNSSLNKTFSRQSSPTILPNINNNLEWQSSFIISKSNLRYSQTMNQPFIVILQFDSNRDPSVNIGRYNPIALAKKIRAITPGPLTISANGQNSTKIICANYSDANKILDHYNNNNQSYLAFPPISLFYKKGFIRNIDTKIALPELFENMDALSKPTILSLKRRVNSGNVLTDIVEITFNSSTIPRFINSFNYLFSVTPMIPPPKRCHYCQRFRHTADQCRSAHPICEFCSQHHITLKCTNRLLQPKCNNCRDVHMASSHDCPRYKYEFELSKVCYIQNLGHLEGSDVLNARGILPPNSPRSMNSSTSSKSSPSQVPNSMPPPPPPPLTTPSTSQFIPPPPSKFQSFPTSTPKQLANELNGSQSKDKNPKQEHRSTLNSIVDNIQTKLSFIEKSFEDSNISSDTSMRQIDDKKND